MNRKRFKNNKINK